MARLVNYIFCLFLCCLFPLNFKARNLENLYIITANFQTTRASAIATWVLGSRGIAFTPVAITNQLIDLHHASESWYRTLRDVIRAKDKKSILFS
jgi:hypothetical protein